MNTPVKTRIALVEDYAPHREELEALLTMEGFETHAADSGESFDDLRITGAFDIVILDLNLPGEEGLSIARRLQSTSPHTRIIMLTGRVRGADKIQGYESGADIYLTKPQRPKELLAVIRALTKRIEPTKDSTQPPAWQLCLRDCTITSPEGELIVLTQKEASLLQRMHLAPNQTLYTSALLDYFELPLTLIGKSRLAGKMSRLRHKIQPCTSGGPVLRALRQDGYQLLLGIQLS